MKLFKCIAFYSLIGLVFQFCATTKTTIEESRMMITFGSCNHQWEKQPLWKSIAKNNPDLFIWLGDIIYSDTEDMGKMRNDYMLQSDNEDYQSFAAKVPIVGIWDDHDYGQNNAGKEYSKKDSSKLLLFEFLKVPADNEAHSRPGAYQKYVYKKRDLTVKVLLLDTRYFRDTLGTPSGTILGDDQWRWLIGELALNDADVHIIGSGVQVLPTEHSYEKWANFPNDRERLIQILDRLNVNYPILISGDRHIGEISSISTPTGKAQLVEVTSSGLTHYYKNFTSEPNSYRVGNVVAELNYGLIDIEKRNGLIYFDASIQNAKNQSKAIITEKYRKATNPQ